MIGFIVLFFFTDCDCVVAGTIVSLRVCGSDDGQCSCKSRVTSRRCSDCTDGFFNLQEDNPFGCMGVYLFIYILFKDTFIKSSQRRLTCQIAVVISGDQ